MLETEIKKLTDAVIANTAAQTGQAAAAPRSAVAPAAQASPAAAAPVVDVLSEGAAAPAVTPVAAAVAAPAVAIPQAGQPAVPAAAVFTKEQVIKAVIKMAKVCGREAATTMMATFGAKKASELNDAAQYPAVMAAIDAALPAADII